MKSSLILIIFLQVSLVFGQSTNKIRYMDNIFDSEDIVTIEDEVYANLEHGNYLISYLKDASWLKRLGKKNSKTQKLINRLYVKELEADIYYASSDHVTSKPLIIFMHGGGYVMGTKKDLSIVALCKSFARKGYVTASINYRLMALDYPSLLKAGYMAAQDGKAAVRYFKEHAEKYRINPNKIYVGGISAGAVTALHTAFLDESEPIAGRNVRFDELLGCLDCSGNDYEVNSSVKGVINIAGGILSTEHLDNNNCSVISFHGTDDKVINIDYDLPFQPYMEEYNLLIYEIDDKWEQFKGLWSKSGAQVDSNIDKAQMIPICGSDRIHSHLNNRYNNHTLTRFPNHGHSLVLSKNNTKRGSGRQLIKEIARFLYLDMN